MGAHDIGANQGFPLWWSVMISGLVIGVWGLGSMLGVQAVLGLGV